MHGGGDVNRIELFDCSLHLSLGNNNLIDIFADNEADLVHHLIIQGITGNDIQRGPVERKRNDTEHACRTAVNHLYDFAGRVFFHCHRTDLKPEAAPDRFENIRLRQNPEIDDHLFQGFAVALLFLLHFFHLFFGNEVVTDQDIFQCLTFGIQHFSIFSIFRLRLFRIANCSCNHF